MDQPGIDRIGVMMASEVWVQTPLEDKDAFVERMWDADTFADLSEPDQELVRRGQLDVAAGNSDIFINPAEWGNWAAIDAAIDSGDTAALDAALETVGALDGGGRGEHDLQGNPIVPDTEEDLE